MCWSSEQNSRQAVAWPPMSWSHRWLGVHPNGFVLLRVDIPTQRSIAQF